MLSLLLVFLAFEAVLLGIVLAVAWLLRRRRLEADRRVTLARLRRI